MARDFYLPKRENDRAIWFANFVEKLKLYAVELGISPALIAQLEDERDVFVAALVVVENIRNSAEAFTSFKNRLNESNDPLGAQPVLPTVPPVPPTVQGNIFGRVRLLVQTIKGNPNYTESIGDDLRIIGEESPDDPNIWKPSLGVQFTSGGVPTILWKKGNSQGIKLWADRGDGTGFQFLAIDTKPNYQDNHDLPPAGQTAIWKYKAIYLLDDTQAGQFSDVLEVTVTGGV